MKALRVDTERELQRVERELSFLKMHFSKLMSCERKLFSPTALNDVPADQGVYLVRCPDGKVLHVGRTNRAATGLKSRLKSHAGNGSSFVRKFFKEQGKSDWSVRDLVETPHSFQYVVVTDVNKPKKALRRRAALEGFASSILSPAHCGEVGDQTKAAGI